jgi:hypothetical protein
VGQGRVGQFADRKQEAFQRFSKVTVTGTKAQFLSVPLLQKKITNAF